jgi:hypothetical protein
MMNPKESGARTEVGPHNIIGVAMEDLPQAERRVLEKELLHLQQLLTLLLKSWLNLWT